MIVDAENYLSSGTGTGQTLNGFAVATTALGNVIDSGPLGMQNPAGSTNNAGRDWGVGYPAWLYVLFTAVPTSGGAATIDLQLVTSAAAALTSPTVMLDLTSGAQTYNGGKFAAGTAYRFAMPRAGVAGTLGWKQFIGLNVIVATAALTGGTIQAFLTRDIQDNLLYQAGFLVQ